MRRDLKDIPKAAKKKSSTSLKVLKQKGPEQQQAPDFETQSAQRPQSSTETERRTQRKGNRRVEDPKHAQEDAKDSRGKNLIFSDEEEDHDDGKQFTEELGHQKRLPAGGERQEAFNAGQGEPSSADGKMDLPPLPFQMLDGSDPNYQEVMKRSGYGVFWVCFPSNAIQSYVNKYAPIFNKVASSRKWRMYPFVYLDTTSLNKKYNHHFCNDVAKITFVMEKTNEAVSDNQQVTYFLSDKRHPESYFRQEYPPDQDITTSAVEEFLDNVHSGKLQKIDFTKGDL